MELNKLERKIDISIKILLYAFTNLILIYATWTLTLWILCTKR